MGGAKLRPLAYEGNCAKHSAVVAFRSGKPVARRVISISGPRIVLFNVDDFPESAPVPAFGPVCTGCGMIGAELARAVRHRH